MYMHKNGIVCHNNVTHCTTTYLILSYRPTGFNKSRTVLLVLFLKPISSLTPLLFLNLYTGSKSISVLSIRFFSLAYKVLTTAQPAWLSPKFDLC